MTFVYLVQYRDNQTQDAWTCAVYETRASANHHIRHAQTQWEALMNHDPKANVSCNCREGFARVEEKVVHQ